MFSAVLTVRYTRAGCGGNLTLCLSELGCIVSRPGIRGIWSDMGQAVQAEDPPGKNAGHLAAPLVWSQLLIVGRCRHFCPPGRAGPGAAAR